MNIDYRLWPNADGVLGEIKTPIPDGVNVKWPEGDMLVGNFVYNKNKLVGLIDTKALVINESATTTIPYEYVKLNLKNIKEDEITVNSGPRTKYLNITYKPSENPII